MESVLGRITSEKLSTKTQELHSDSDLDEKEQAGSKAKSRGSELIQSTTDWLPLYSMWCWKDPDTREKCTTLAVILPSEVGDRDGQVYVYIDNEAYLAIRVNLPSALTDSTKHHKL